MALPSQASGGAKRNKNKGIVGLSFDFIVADIDKILSYLPEYLKYLFKQSRNARKKQSSKSLHSIDAVCKAKLATVTHQTLARS